jgi:NAD(P)-dependent dehydrogenase (short-subunit alcohol dehydrogenase family)
VTGGNSGIGLALCKLLATSTQPKSEFKTPAPPPCYVFLGARSLERGKAAVKKIVDEFPDAAGKIEVLQIDVSDDASCAKAAAELKSKGVSLYALVNNAGLGLAQNEAQDSGAARIMNTNFYGPKRVTEAMADLIDPTEGRIVNTSSGAASMWLKKQDAALKALLSNPGITFDELDRTIKAQIAANNLGMGNGYGMSKAALNGVTLIHAKAYPHLKAVALSPGFIDTPMTKGFGAKLTPEQGCVSSLVCLFSEVTSGYYYGSDGIRSPFTMTRDPGMPPYEGEDNPAQEKYNR